MDTVFSPRWFTIGRCFASIMSITTGSSCNRCQLALPLSWIDMGWICRSDDASQSNHLWCAIRDGLWLYKPFAAVAVIFMITNVWSFIRHWSRMSLRFWSLRSWSSGSTYTDVTAYIYVNQIVKTAGDSWPWSIGLVRNGIVPKTIHSVDSVQYMYAGFISNGIEAADHLLIRGYLIGTAFLCYRWWWRLIPGPVIWIKLFKLK